MLRRDVRGRMDSRGKIPPRCRSWFSLGSCFYLGHGRKEQFEVFGFIRFLLLILANEVGPSFLHYLMIGASLKENEWYKDFLQPADARPKQDR
jgi:hypothetical protein